MSGGPLKKKITHIFLAGGEQWCSELVDYYQSGGQASSLFEHAFVSGEQDFISNSAIYHDSRIDAISSRKMNSLNLFSDYAKQSDLLFLYNNILPSLDRARLPMEVVKKTVWLSFGSDLDCERNSGWKGSSITSCLYHALALPLIESVSRFKMSRLRAVAVNDVSYDASIVRRDYGDVPLYGFSYLKNDAITSIPKSSNTQRPSSEVRVLLGHHGYPGINHLGMLRRLRKFAKDNMTVVIPLVYGDRTYIEKVKSFALSDFEGKVEIITTPMSYDSYAELLSTIDIAIFDTDKNIAVGNIAILCNYGKKIYTRKDGGIAKRLRMEGVQTYDSNSIGSMSFADFASPVEHAESGLMYCERLETFLQQGEDRMRILLSELAEDV